MSLWQELADNFYPERADFTTTRSLGQEFAPQLMTSYPLLARRDLGNQLGVMLRSGDWFHMSASNERIEDNESKRWMEWATGQQRRAMYDRAAQFARATKEGDHDYAGFGQCVLSIEVNRRGDTLLYRCWHLRDVAWVENEEGKIGQVFRKWKPTARDLIRLFGDKVHADTKREAEKDPFTEQDCLHMIVESDLYSGNAKGRPYWSLYYDCKHEKLLEDVAWWSPHYVIPRWQTVSGSQYAFSPAAVAALPDGRLIQAMTRTLLEAGEKHASPPMLAVQEAIRSDISLFAGGITYVDSEYDERLGEVLRPLTQDKGGMPLGVEMQQDCRRMIAEAFYLNKISLPTRNPEMTAYEVGQRIQEYIRNALPIFEPMEMDYNGGICELTFDLMLRNGAFGPREQMPRALQELFAAGQPPVHFRFKSPLHDVIEQARGQKFMEAKAMIAEATALDPTAAHLPDAVVALRDVLMSIGVPARWVRPEEEVEERAEAQNAAAEAQMKLGLMQQGADVAKTAGEAGQMLPGGGAGEAAIAGALQQ